MDAKLKAAFPAEVGKGDVAVWLGTLPLPRLRSTLISHERRFWSLSPNASRRQCARSSQVNYRHRCSQLLLVGFPSKRISTQAISRQRDSSPIKGYCESTLNQPVCDFYSPLNQFSPRGSVVLAGSCFSLDHLLIFMVVVLFFLGSKNC